ncbi:hypothetical protein L1275_000078 [Flavobacterium sp. HSC-61S13]|nr:hypothetical protein [Flavobacterium sp. HSC-61S13]
MNKINPPAFKNVTISKIFYILLIIKTGLKALKYNIKNNHNVN